MVSLVRGEEHEDFYAAKFFALNRNTRFGVSGNEAESLFDLIAIDGFLRNRVDFIDRVLSNAPQSFGEGFIKLNDDAAKIDELLLRSKSYPNGQQMNVTDYILCGITLDNDLVIIKNKNRGDILDLILEKEMILKMLKERVISD